MVLGLRTNTRKGPSVQLDYIIHIQEIKPWPPSQSLRNLRGVLIQWEHGDRNSGLTNQVVPLLDTGADVGDGRIEFNESFKIHFSLLREMSVKGGDGDTFQKNCIEFNLYEPRRDKTVKGQLLGTAVLDLADCGIVKESLSISVPINCKRTYRNTAQPLLFLRIQPFEKSSTSSSSKDKLMRESSMDRNHVECVSTLMREEYAEEAEVASYTTDDDVSSHSSQAIASSAAEYNGSLSPKHKERDDNQFQNSAVAENGNAEEANNGHDYAHFVETLDEKQMTESNVNMTGNSSCFSSKDLSSDLAWISKKIISRSLQPLAAEGNEKERNSTVEDEERESGGESILENTVDGKRDEGQEPSSKEAIFSSPIAQEKIADLDNRADNTLDSALNHSHDHVHGSCSHQGDMLEGECTNSSQNGSADNETRENNQDYVNKRIVDKKEQHIEEPLGGSSQVDVQKQVKLFENVQVSGSEEDTAFIGDLSTSDKSKQGRSVRSSPDSNKRNGSVRSSEHKDTRLYTMETKNLLSDSVVQHLENRIKNLEGELREAAAIEISLYSVVAEHGSSTTKVHAPARRLSRLYFHARKQNPNSRRGSAAKSIVSGLVLVAKACGNDVPRLTFWLSNSIVLRVIMSKSLGTSQLRISIRPITRTVGGRNGRKKSPSLKWESFPSKGMRSATEESFGDWENPLAFTAALEKVETWIFSRIIESIWWQTFTPHMQSGAAKSINISMDSDSSKLHRTTSSSSEQERGNFSLELWKKAFRDACERICPVRAGGHDCGCLPLLSRLIMEQLIARLDVAMFNAILRESADEIPTDPVADPISDADVLPIPAGKASFGAGAQLKNAIGHWSRWLTDLFGIDDDELPENGNGSETVDDDELRSSDTTSKSFHLLNALSDLMMLPKDMLLSRTIRKEVCPTFGPPLIRRVLNCFIPDEFCPDPIPGVVLEALNSSDSFDDTEEDFIMTFPCAAASIVYEPPSASSVAGFSGESGGNPLLTHNGSSLLKKSQTSDDELDELDSPLKSAHLDLSQSFPSSMKPTRVSNKITAVRYQLLRDVWMNSE